MAKSPPTANRTLNDEQRHVLDYIGGMSLELSVLAARSGFDDLARELAGSSAAAQARLRLAGTDQAKT